MVQQVNINVADENPTVQVKDGMTEVGRAPSAISPIYGTTWAPEVRTPRSIDIAILQFKEFQGKRLLAYTVQRRVTVVEFDPHGNISSSHDYPNDFLESTSGK